MPQTLAPAIPVALTLPDPTTGFRCTNAEPGTFNHECGKPATVTVKYRAENSGALVGYPPIEFAITHYCPRCWANGTEAQAVKARAVAVRGA